MQKIIFIYDHHNNKSWNNEIHNARAQILMVLNNSHRFQLLVSEQFFWYHILNNKYDCLPIVGHIEYRKPYFTKKKNQKL